eukprot:CAMPEP_0119414476 /NCGR_PEP_ID=MMETSP1335-20130426/7017_1 /TAXON_ID=259385 /ORGANISM="Chrysoculter rhomboideus, Strain RCC1486" /LENGTH=221 /DNA_ID=CAMNT_0007439357 /DNA_START=33 /DNA_END=699 /DNA_ORIENTATION=+
MDLFQIQPLQFDMEVDLEKMMGADETVDVNPAESVQVFEADVADIDTVAGTDEKNQHAHCAKKGKHRVAMRTATCTVRTRGMPTITTAKSTLLYAGIVNDIGLKRHAVGIAFREPPRICCLCAYALTECRRRAASSQWRVHAISTQGATFSFARAGLCGMSSSPLTSPSDQGRKLTLFTLGDAARRMALGDWDPGLRADEGAAGAYLTEHHLSGWECELNL